MVNHLYCDIKLFLIIDILKKLLKFDFKNKHEKVIKRDMRPWIKKIC